MIFLSSHPFIEEKGDDIFLTIKAHPNSSQKEIKLSEYSFDVYINESADKGKANKAIIKLVSKVLQLPSSQIDIVKGLKSQTKILYLKGIKKQYILKKLE